MRDVTERRRVKPRRPRPITVGIPDEKVVPIITPTQFFEELANGRPILADQATGQLHTVPRDRPARGN